MIASTVSAHSIIKKHFSILNGKVILVLYSYIVDTLGTWGKVHWRTNQPI